MIISINDANEVNWLIMKKRVVVIGSGIAGTILCNELVHFFDVILLEKGAENHISFPALECSSKPLAIVPTFCHGGGGTTNLWHNGLVPINDEDLTQPVFRQIMKEAKPWVDKAASALFFLPPSFSTEYQRNKAELQRDKVGEGPLSQGVDCLMYPKKYRKLTVSGSVKAFYGVESIDFIAAGQQLSSIRYALGGQWYTVTCDFVIIAAGALGSPPLVHRLLNDAGCPNHTVGQGFIDHPMGFVGKIKIKPEYVPLIRRLALWDHGSYESRNPIRIKSKCGQYTACAYFRPAITMDNRLAIYKYKSSLGASNGVNRLKNLFSWKLFHPDIMAEVFSHLFGVNLSSRTYNILFLTEQKRGCNKVWEQNGRVHIDWSITEEEIILYREMLETLRENLVEFAEEINIITDITADWLWSAAHHSGTLSLGNEPTDILDATLCLRGCDNVYVCDGSVLQEHSYANTGLAIAQLAFRLAHHLTVRNTAGSVQEP